MRLFRTIPNIDFIGQKKLAYILSALLCLLAFVLYATVGFNYGIDFKGGINFQVKFSELVSSDDIRSALGERIGETPNVVRFGDPADNEKLIEFGAQDNEKSNEALLQKVKQAIGELYPQAEIRQVETIGPKVGSELKENALYSVLFSFLVILIYLGIRFKYYYGLAALVSLVHDTVVTLGLIILFKQEFNLSALAALLTVNGYSLNDTIVVFDRLRENIGKHPSKNLFQLINLSVNETLSRTIVTAGTTLISILFLFIFGGEGISSFAFPIIVGIIVGTYSSVFVASPFLLLFYKEDGVKPRGDAEDGVKASADPTPAN